MAEYIRRRKGEVQGADEGTFRRGQQETGGKGMRNSKPTYIRNSAILAVVVALVVGSSLCWAKEKTDSGKYLNAVREFADNVLKYGRDTYGPKHTPLFVDGLNIHTHDPVKWIFAGQTWILSNFASHQNLFRTLDGLTTITGDPKYRQAAEDSIEYAFSNLRTLNGLIYWGGHLCYDALRDEPTRTQKNWHELKHIIHTTI
jgi:hypothetical protein